MSTVPSRQSPQDGGNQLADQRLPLRWLVIAVLSIAAGAVGMMTAGAVAAIATACAVATALHRIIV